MLTYCIKSIICAGIFYGYYRLALRNQAYHQWNRVYLLGAIAASLLLPCLHFYTLPVQATYTAPLVSVQQAFTQPSAHPIIINYPYTVYWLVSIVLVLRLVLNYFQLYRLRRNSHISEQQGYRLAIHDSVSTPFSFFGQIFWGGPILPASPEGRQILLHEQAHIQGRHSADKLLLELVCALCWFNPFYYLMKRELTMVHEFIADKAASNWFTPGSYARTILQMAMSSTQPLIHSFGHPPVKRRIQILFSQHKNYAFMKKMLIIPLAALLTLLISWRQNDVQPGTFGFNTQDTVYEKVDEAPTYPGGEYALALFLNHNVKYPSKAQKLGLMGTTFTEFIVTSEGNVTDIHTVSRKIGGGLEEEAIRVIQLMPKWNPGKKDGKAVNVKFTLPIRFSMSGN